MIREISYQVSSSGITPYTVQNAGVQGEHNVTRLSFNFTSDLLSKLSETANGATLYYRFDTYDSLGCSDSTEPLPLGETQEVYYDIGLKLSAVGGNAKVYLVITSIKEDKTEAELISFPALISFTKKAGAEYEQLQKESLSTLYNGAVKSAEATEEARKQTENNTQMVLKVVNEFPGIEEKLDNADKILAECQEATSIAKDAASGVVTIEQNRQLPLKFSVMTQEEYDNTPRPDPDGCVTLDIIEDDTWVNFVYPVGSIYMSVNEVEPSTLFGGTWERIKDRFLLSCGDKYAAGSIEGKEENVLTEKELPPHRHGIVEEGKYVLAATSMVERISLDVAQGAGVSNVLQSKDEIIRISENTKTYVSGGGAAFTNMPPYLAVYMWKRIA